MNVVSIKGGEIEPGYLHEGILKLSDTVIDVAKTAIDDLRAMQDEGWVDLEILKIHLTTIHDVAVFIHGAGMSIEQGLS
ncbi:hypothetical protein SAMN05216516_10532 [Izhakiella capsodis]|uniref:Uncharacterized protein n=1 Tax=Izhakiella capsodis TaxID=1367852 RepID=A0A1I4XX87_9GAMM|nr:hypothetical protein [Izhakiella capsodis]SFN29890.1 hypothetical protein SAMN05216516_10532 [Izhakiella capsodis]